MNVTSPMAVSTNSWVRREATPTIFYGGLIAGTLDLTAAFVSNWLEAHVTPVQVMQAIASGLLGVASFAGGARTAVLGVALHFLIATVATAVYYIASRTGRIPVERPIIAGLLYGVGVYAFMNFVVLPLSKFPQRVPTPVSKHILGLFIVMLCIGVPIATIARRFSKRRSEPLLSPALAD